MPERTVTRGRKAGRNAGQFVKGDARINRTKPGTGRPRNTLRAKMRGSLEDRLVIAEQIADDETAAPVDRMRALEWLAKYGLGPRNTTQRHELTGKNGEPLVPQSIVIGGKAIVF